MISGFELAYRDSGNTIHFSVFTIQISTPSQKNNDTKSIMQFLIPKQRTFFSAAVRNNFNISGLDKSRTCVFYLLETQSQEITQSWHFSAAIVYVIAKLFRYFQTPQSAQKFLLSKSVVNYLCHLKSNNIIGQRKTTNKEKHFYP